MLHEARALELLQQISNGLERARLDVEDSNQYLLLLAKVQAIVAHDTLAVATEWADLRAKK